MAKCKLCKANIPDGTEYCKDCLAKNNSKLNESYLDSLLNSVINTVPSGGNSINKKKSTDPSESSEYPESKPENTDTDNSDNSFNHKPSVNPNKKSEDKIPIKDTIPETSEDEASFDIDFKDLEDFEALDISSDLDDNIIISDEELFGGDLKELISEDEDNEPDKPSALTKTPQGAADHIQANVRQMAESAYDIAKDDKLPAESFLKTDTADMNTINNGADQNTDTSVSDSEGSISSGKEKAETLYNAAADDSSGDKEEIDEKKKAPEAEDSDAYLKDLLNELDIKGTDDIEPGKAGGEAQPDTDDEGRINSEVKQQSDKENTAADKTIDIDMTPHSDNQIKDENAETQGLDSDGSQKSPEDDEILDLLNQISSDDPVSGDVQAISQMLSGKAAPEGQKAEEKVPGDVGEVFSDALKVVTSLDDPDIDEISSLEHLEEAKKDTKKPKEKKEKKKKEKKIKVKKEKVKKEKKKKEKKVKPNKKDKAKEEGTEKEAEGKSAPSKKAGETAGGSPSTGKKEKQKPSDEASTAAKSDLQKGKQKKVKKKGASEDQNKEEGSSDGSKSDKGKQAEKADSKKDKKEKKEKKKKDKEIMQVMDEIDEDDGKINRLGASFVFIFFGIFVVILLIGTNIFSYTLSIKNATDYFGHHKYTEAYDEVYGIDIKDEDLVIYNKIMTVMFVNKQLNSYNNYFAIGEYPEALDSLLKGLKRYDKYIELATMMGIKSDLEYVRNQILSELKTEFNLTEEDAVQIINSENQAQYSVKVYNAVLENMNH